MFSCFLTDGGCDDDDDLQMIHFLLLLSVAANALKLASLPLTICRS